MSGQDLILSIMVLTNLLLIGSSRLAGGIRLVALQGFVLGLVPLLMHWDDWTVRIVVMSVTVITLKGIVFPMLLNRAAQWANVRREVEPFIGFTPSLLVGTLFFGISIWLGYQLPLPQQHLSSLLVPVSFFTMLIGLFLIITRRKALTQVMGYVVLENGIFTFGLAALRESHLVVEVGILLDVFVAVFVMGITIFRIKGEFDHIDTDLLTDLKG